MPNRPQFTLKAILAILTVLSVPLGMMVSGYGGLRVIGYFLLLATSGGSLGYLLGGRGLAFIGAGVGLYMAAATGRVFFG